MEVYPAVLLPLSHPEICAGVTQCFLNDRRLDINQSFLDHRPSDQGEIFPSSHQNLQQKEVFQMSIVGDVLETSHLIQPNLVPSIWWPSPFNDNNISGRYFELLPAQMHHCKETTFFLGSQLLIDPLDGLLVRGHIRAQILCRSNGIRSDL